MRILAVGDVIGRPGRSFLRRHLDALMQNEGIDFVVANGENASGGVGITREVCQELLSMGVDVITSGNHIWDKKEVFQFIDEEPRLLRPANYPGEPPGSGSGVFTARTGQQVGVMNASGRVFTGIHFACPFRWAAGEARRLRQVTPIVLLDFHAEATSEKIAMGHYLDGKVSAVLGTHTHVQTADEMVLPGGTAFITDLGMTGPWISVIGVRPELVLEKFLSQMPVKFEVARGPCQLNAVVVDVDESGGMARGIRRISFREHA
ncbi:MAG: TIGR00282 family metallophosphoesterase [Bacillota bacterium]